MVGNNAVGRWDLLGLIFGFFIPDEDKGGNTQSNYLKEQNFNGPCYSLEVEGELLVETYLTNETSRRLKIFGKGILGKRFKFLKGLMDTIELGLTEGGDLATSLEVTYQITLLIEFECECETSCGCSGSSDGEDWEEEQSFTAADFKAWETKSDLEKEVNGSGFGAHNPFPLDEASAEELKMMVSQNFHSRLGKAKKKCANLCK
jgi:hypothetical protein